MGRPERSVDPEAGPVARFAWDLRSLRAAAGSPSYRALASAANYSPTVLSRAAGGRELASLPVVLAYVGACGGDREEWRERWEALAAQIGLLPVGAASAEAGTAESPAFASTAAESTASDTTASGGDAAASAATAASSASIRARLRRLASNGSTVPAAAAVGAVVAAGVLAVVMISIPGATPSSGAPTQTRPTALSGSPTTTRPTVIDGEDPKESGCAGDAVTVAQAALRLSRAETIGGATQPAGTVVGLVELRYSARCHAGWARLTPADAYSGGLAHGSVTITITRPHDGTTSSYGVGTITSVFSDQLLTAPGCLSASAVLAFTGARPASAATSCWS